MSIRPESSDAKRAAGGGPKPTSVRVLDLPSLLPAKRPSPKQTPPPAPKPLAVSRPSVVHWPVVLGAGAAAWFLVVGVVVAGWALSRPVEAPAEEAVARVDAPADPSPAPVESARKGGAKKDEKLAAVEPAAAPKLAAVLPEAGVKLAFKEGPADRDPRLPPELVEDKVAAEAPRPFDLEAAPVKKKNQSCGTAVTFLDDPEAAFKAAKEDKKVVFLVHVAGNFEDSKFT